MNNISTVRTATELQSLGELNLSHDAWLYFHKKLKPEYSLPDLVLSGRILPVCDLKDRDRIWAIRQGRSLFWNITYWKELHEALKEAGFIHPNFSSRSMGMERLLENIYDGYVPKEEKPEYSVSELLAKGLHARNVVEDASEFWDNEEYEAHQFLTEQEVTDLVEIIKSNTSEAEYLTISYEYNLQDKAIPQKPLDYQPGLGYHYAYERLRFSREFALKVLNILYPEELGDLRTEQLTEIVAKLKIDESDLENYKLNQDTTKPLSKHLLKQVGLPNRAFNSLMYGRKNCLTLEDIVEQSKGRVVEYLLETRGLGPKSMLAVLTKLQEYQLI